MGKRTTVSKDRLEQLLAIESMYNDMCRDLQALASNGGAKSFTSKMHNLEVTIYNQDKTTVKDWN